MLLKYLLVFLIAMLPVAELRLAVPLAVGMDLAEIPSIFVCVLGNIIPVPFIYFFARKVLSWGQDKPVIGRFFRFFLTKGERAGHKLLHMTGKYGMFVALMLFVGIPLPGTGAWTGTMAASFLDIGPKIAVPAVSLGVVIAGCIMALASMGVFHIIGL